MNRVKATIVIILAVLLFTLPVAAQRLEQTEVHILISTLLGDMANDMEQLVMEHVPGVRVVTTVDGGRAPELYEQVASGKYDVVALTNAQGLRELLLPLDGFIVRSGMTNPLFESMRIEGRLYELPMSLNPEVMVFNREVFDRNGLAYPSTGVTWEEFIHIVTHLRDAGTGGSGTTYNFAMPHSIMIGNRYWTAVVYQSGYEPLDADFEILARALAVAKELANAQPLSATAGFGVAREFRLGEVPIQWMSFSEAMMQINHDMARSPFRLPFEWGIAPLPHFYGGERINPLSLPITVGITLDTPRPDIAWEVAKVLATKSAALPGWRLGPSAYHTSSHDLDAWIATTVPFVTETMQDELRQLFQRRHMRFGRPMSHVSSLLASWRSSSMRYSWVRRPKKKLWQKYACSEMNC